MNSNKKYFLLVSLLVCTLFGFGFDSCDSSNPEAERQTRIKQENTESLMKKQPTPQIGFSMDRYLLSERLVRFNDPNKMNYLYVFAGNKVYEITIVGKVASTSKRLTDPEGWVNFANSTSSANQYRVPVADETGTWGSSDPARLAMTTLGSLIEFGGFMGYFYSETQFSFANGASDLVKITVEINQEEKLKMANDLLELKKAFQSGKTK